MTESIDNSTMAVRELAGALRAMMTAELRILTALAALLDERGELPDPAMPGESRDEHGKPETDSDQDRATDYDG